MFTGSVSLRLIIKDLSHTTFWFTLFFPDRRLIQTHQQGSTDPGLSRALGGHGGGGGVGPALVSPLTAEQQWSLRKRESVSALSLTNSCGVDWHPLTTLRSRRFVGKRGFLYTQLESHLLASSPLSHAG